MFSVHTRIKSSNIEEQGGQGGLVFMLWALDSLMSCSEWSYISYVIISGSKYGRLRF